MLDTIRDAALEVERPIFFSLLIIVSAYIPLFTLERVERRLFTPMAFTVCYALFGSMLLALTLIPVLATYLFRHAPSSLGEPGADAGCHARYERALRVDDRVSRRVSSAAAALVVAAAFVVATLLGSEFLPQLDEGVIWIRANFPAGISLDQVGRARRARSAGSSSSRRRCARSPRRPVGTTMAPIRTDRIATSCSWR